MENLLEVFKYLSAPFDNKEDDIKKESPHSLIAALTEKCWEKLHWNELPSSFSSSCSFKYHHNNEDRRNEDQPHSFREIEIGLSSSSSATWKFTCTILELLTQLRTKIEEVEVNQSIEERSIEVLSLQHQMWVQKCVELVIGFGILPYLLPGVGVPEKLRETNKTLTWDRFCDEDRRAFHLVQYFRLCHVIETLLTISEHPSLSILILPKHHCDILASLLQICKAPLAKPSSTILSSSIPIITATIKDENIDKMDIIEVQENENDKTTQLEIQQKQQQQNNSYSNRSNTSPLTLNEYKYVLSRREKLNILLETNFLISPTVQKETLVNSLFVIGASKKPRWIGKSCYKILYSILLSDNNGLLTITRTTINSLGRSNIWKVIRIISNLINEAIHINFNNENNSNNNTTTTTTTTTSTIEESLVEERIINLSNQAYDMLISSHNVCTSKNLDSSSSSFDLETIEHLTTIALTVGLKLLHLNHHVAEKYFWNRLFEPLLNSSQPNLRINQINNPNPSSSSSLSLSSTTATSLSSSSPSTTSTFTSTLSVSIEKVETCILFLDKLLNMAPAIDFSFPVNSFYSIWSVLFQLFVTCESYMKRKVQEPRVADRVQKLHHKLESVLLNLFLVLDSIHEAIPESDKKSSTFLCEFCIHLILNDVHKTTNTIAPTNTTTVTTVTGGNSSSSSCDGGLTFQNNCNSNFRVNRFQFDIVECLDHDSNEEDVIHQEKIQNDNNIDEVRYARDRDNSQVKMNTTTTTRSSSNMEDEIKIDIVRRKFSCQNPHDNDNDDNNTFERLSDDCAILSTTILKKEQVKRVTGKLFCQLLGYTEGTGEEDEVVQRVQEKEEEDKNIQESKSKKIVVVVDSLHESSSTSRHYNHHQPSTHQSRNNFVVSNSVTNTTSTNTSTTAASTSSSSASSPSSVVNSQSESLGNYSMSVSPNKIKSNVFHVGSNIITSTTTTTSQRDKVQDIVEVKEEKLEGITVTTSPPLSNTTTATSTTSTTFKTRPIYHSKVLTKLDLQEKVQCQKFVVMKLLGDLGTDESIVEDLGAVQDPLKTLEFLELIMKKLTIEMNSAAQTGDPYEFSQSVIFSLGILGTLCETCVAAEQEDNKKKMKQNFRGASANTSTTTATNNNNNIWNELKRFTPYLQSFRCTSHPGLMNAGIPSMAQDILISIETRGSHGLEGSSSSNKRKIEKLSRFEEALRHVNSPMLPIKGHGLLELRRLVEDKDPQTLKNEQLLLQIFKEAIKHDDSYVYLMAIQGMASLGLKYHSSTVPILITEYGCFDESMSKKMSVLMSTEERIEFRMKIGEALVKIVQRLGDMAPIYRAPLTNIFFHVVRDEDPLIRASALSNLGELCHLLKFTLGIILTEVWHCVESILTFEKHVEVRRAALHLIVLLLRGVEKDFTTNYLIQEREIGQYLRDARRLLMRIHETETDPASSLHAQLAIQELELIVRKLLTPTNKMEYKIRVLDPL